MEYRYTVITCNFGGYEIMREIDNPLDDVEYLYITDDETTVSSTWTVIYDKDYNKYSNPFDKVISFRSKVLNYCHTNVCIRIDASIQIHGNAYENLYNEFISNGYDISFVLSPAFNDSYSEKQLWSNIRGIKEEDLNVFFEYYNMHNNDDLLLHQTICTLGILVQNVDETNFRVNEKQLEILEDIKKYGCLENYYRVDQIVFTYIINKYFNHLNILPLTYDLHMREESKICHHNSKCSITNFNCSHSVKYEMINKDIISLYNGDKYVSILTKEQIINNSIKLHIDLCEDIYSKDFKYRFNSNKNSYCEWLKRNDVTIIKPEYYCYHNPFSGYEMYLLNDSYYDKILPILCEKLNIDYNPDDFVKLYRNNVSIVIPKHIKYFAFYVPLYKKYENMYYLYYNLNNIHYEYTTNVITFDDVYLPFDITNEKNEYFRQFKYGKSSFRVHHMRPKLNNEKRLLVISDASILPFIHILLNYYYEIFVINNYFYNLKYDFLYNYKDIDDILILTSNNKPLSLMIDNL